MVLYGMQRQQERPLDKPSKQRSVVELLLAWLLVFGGGVTTAVCVSDYLRSTHLDPVFDSVMYTVLLLQGVLGFLGGTAFLLRYRTVVRWSLRSAALFSFVTAVGIAYFALQDYLQGNFQKEPALFVAAMVVAFLALATALIFLGRWLGRKDDDEG